MKNKKKIIEKDKIAYLKDKIDELFEMYPNSFTSQWKKLLKILANNENKIDYKNLSYKILFPDSTFHTDNFSKKYGPLSSLLEGLVTGEMTVKSAIIDQISFIISLMYGYNEWELYDIKKLKSEFFHGTIITKAKGIKSFFPKNINEFI